MKPLRLQSLALRLALVTPIRLVLGGAALAGALVAGRRTGAALAAFALGAACTAAVLVADPRHRVAERAEPSEAPVDAVDDAPLRQAWTAMLPSTVVVNGLAWVALAKQPTLTALLAGGSAGMALAGLVSLPRLRAREAAAGGVLLVDRAARHLYVRRAAEPSGEEEAAADLQALRSPGCRPGA